MSFRTNLRARVALGIALPVWLILALLSLMQYRYQRQLLEDQIQLSVLQLGEVMMGSLRRAMLDSDFEMLSQTLADMGRMETIQQVQLVSLDGQVIADSHSENVGTVWRLEDRGCIECHQFSVGSRPRTTRFSASGSVLRISTPIPNEPDCTGCHVQEDAHLGVLLADMSIVETEARLRDNLRADLAISAGGTVLVILGMYFLMHWLVVRRVEAFYRPLIEFASGDFSARLPPSPTPTDELGELANTFNRMADELDRQTHEREHSRKLRRRAVAEERERIARELHDGLAQLLGYVTTKAMAVRQMLKQQQTQDADQNLLQLEEAARELLSDVREAIIDLKMAEQDDVHLTASLRDYTDQFNRLSDLPVELTLAPAAEDLSLPSETALHLLRIVQESLTNVRKHALATTAWINLQINGGTLDLTIHDDGKGFDPDRIRANKQRHFGLDTMGERAGAIGAEFELASKPGAGTHITIRLPLEDLKEK